MASFFVLEVYNIVFSGYNNSIVIYPPNKISKRYYRCDNKFHLDCILDMYKSETKYGICLISGKEYRCYILEIRGSHKQFKLIKSDTQEIMNQHKTGGQSALRFQRLRDGQIDHYIKKICEQILKSYLTNNNSQYLIQKLIIAGPGLLKKNVLDHDLFKQYFKDKILQIMTTSEINDNTVHEIYDECYHILETKENIKAKLIIENIKDLIKNNVDQLVFGIDEVFNELKLKTLSRIIISNNFDNNIKEKIIDLNDNFSEIILVNDNYLDDYGCIVGIKYY